MYISCQPNSFNNVPETIWSTGHRLQNDIKSITTKRRASTGFTLLDFCVARKRHKKQTNMFKDLDGVKQAKESNK